ncbi:MAG: nucleoside 2-deoxyribosyltransferase [Candidatus Cryptobacteroides sp.]
MKKIYFAGSIRGGREDAGLYNRIISYISRTEKVLTEHIGRPNVEDDEKQMTDQDIYEQDTAWLRECDMVIAECTNASLGVGYEMAYAEMHKKPVHIFYDRTRTRLSAMLSGDVYFHLHPYSSEEELLRTLSDILGCPCSKTACPRFGNCEECRKHHADSSRPRPCGR